MADAAAYLLELAATSERSAMLISQKAKALRSLATALATREAATMVIGAMKAGVVA